MNIIFLANSKWYLKNFRSNTINVFKDKYNVSCVAPEDNDININSAFLPLYMQPASTAISSEVKTVLHLAKILFKIKPAVVFSFNPKPNIYSLICASIFNHKVIVNVSGVGSASKIPGLKGFLYNLSLNIFFKKACYVFFQNEDDKVEFINKGIISSDKCEVLPGSGVDLKKFFPIENRSNCRRFILAARLIKPKGIMEYLQASALIKKENKFVDVMLAGVADDSDRAVSLDVIQEYEESSVVKFLGMRSDIHKVFLDVDCVVLPSYYPEGTPRSLLEAAAAGKVIITTDTPGCRDVVIEGVNGFLVPPRDTEALKEAMAKVINLPNEKLAEMQANSRKLAEEKFDEQYVIQRYLDVAEEILAKKSK